MRCNSDHNNAATAYSKLLVQYTTTKRGKRTAVATSKQANNANMIWVETRRHWIQTDNVGRTDIVLAWKTTDPRATTPCQDTSAQPPELIPWEEAKIIFNHSDVQGRTLENWINIIVISITTKFRKSLILI